MYGDDRHASSMAQKDRRPGRWRGVLAGMLLAGWALAGCAVGVMGADGREEVSGALEDIRRLVRIQEQAIQAGDVARYMQTIVPDDALYWQEQQHWAADAVTFVQGKTYRRAVKKWIERRENEVVAAVEQFWTDGRNSFRVEVPIRFRCTPDGWKDADLPFWQTQKKGVAAKVTHRRLLPLAEELVERAEHTRQRLSALYGWQPRQPVTLKLYGDADWFRQSVKLSLPSWVGGWHEYGESIKLSVESRRFLLPAHRPIVHAAVIHEMVHQMVSELTNDNAAYWLQEGLAEHVTALLDAIPENNALPAVDPETGWSWLELAAVQLEQLPAEQAEQYYRQARHVVAYLLDCYGDGALRAVLVQLQQYPCIPGSAAEKQDILHRRTVQALETVLEKPFVQLDREWQHWARAQA